jgi:hypothetical protein
MLRGTTLIRLERRCCDPSPSFGPSRGQCGIHYSGFTDPGSEASSTGLPDWLAPPASSLKNVLCCGPAE